VVFYIKEQNRNTMEEKKRPCNMMTNKKGIVQARVKIEDKK